MPDTRAAGSEPHLQNIRNLMQEMIAHLGQQETKDQLSAWFAQNSRRAVSLPVLLKNSGRQALSAQFRNLVATGNSYLETVSRAGYDQRFLTIIRNWLALFSEKFASLEGLEARILEITGELQILDGTREEASEAHEDFPQSASGPDTDPLHTVQPGESSPAPLSKAHLPHATPFRFPYHKAAEFPRLEAGSGTRVYSEMPEGTTPAIVLLRALQNHIRNTPWHTGLGGDKIRFERDPAGQFRFVPGHVAKQLDVIQGFIEQSASMPNATREVLARQAVQKAFFSVPEDARRQASPWIRLQRFLFRDQETAGYYRTFVRGDAQAISTMLQVADQGARNLLQEMKTEMPVETFHSTAAAASA